ncbi:hypothetical protein CLIB1444_09S01816 [[Candida] jaroonii]|uniref:Uncharacterized protein n=1 Tax=[Candida] jaroonii TaxID=467808 RepID=A0ACA9YC88_9ASCO|nr:hypothetical protein CLIB1444_09S01816 [[Candida] jaroonii]
MNTELSIKILHDQQKNLLPRGFNKGEDYTSRYQVNYEENKKRCVSCSPKNCCKRRKVATNDFSNPAEKCFDARNSVSVGNLKSGRMTSSLKYHYKERPTKRVSWSDEIIWEEPDNYVETPEANSIHISLYESTFMLHAGKRVCF